LVFKRGNKAYLLRDPKKHRESLNDSIKKRDYFGRKNPNWKSGFVMIKGYRYVYAPSHPNATKQGYVLEHRLIVEKNLSRLLKKNEIVHHINGDKLDNGFENLKIFSSVGKHCVAEHCKRDEAGIFVSHT